MSGISRNNGSFDGFGRRIRLAGEKPNSAAMRIMISAFFAAIETYGDCIGYPLGEFITGPKFWSAAWAPSQAA